MNILQLVMKQMRQRSLSTWLTLLSVLLGVGLAIAIMIIRRQGAAIFGQTNYGYDVLIGAKGSPLQLVLNTVYHLDKSPGNISYTFYQKLTHDPSELAYVHTAVPFTVGDSYQGIYPIVGTLPTLFDTPLTRVRDAVDGERDLARKISDAMKDKQPLPDDFDFPGTQARLHTELLGAESMVSAYVPSTSGPIAKGLEQLDAATQLGKSLPDPGTSVPDATALVKALQTTADTLAPPEQALKQDMGLSDTLNLSTVGPVPYRPGKLLEVAKGRIFAGNKFQAVVGYDVANAMHLKIGQEVHATHGFPRPGQKPDVHAESWKICGILAQTHTASDRVLYIPLMSAYTIAEHGAALIAQAALRNGQNPNEAIKKADEAEEKKTGKPAIAVAPDDVKHYTVDAQGRIHLDIPRKIWGISGIMMRSRSPALVLGFMYDINNGKEAAAVNPASTMRQFFAIFLKPSTIVLQVIVALTTIVAGVGILVSIYNSVAARLREIAILRALGATRIRILTLICLEAGLIGLIGGFIGIIAGHLLGLAGSVALDHFIGEGFNWLATDRWEWIYLGAVTLLAVLAGLVPAMKAYKTPVATNLTAT